MTTDRPRAYAIIEERSQNQFLNLYDRILSLGRVKWEVVDYDPATRREKDRASAFMEITALRWLVHQVLAGQAIRPGWRFTVRGGSDPQDGPLEHRFITVEFDPAGRQYTEIPFRVTITTSLGKPAATGGIAPAELGNALSIRFAVGDFEGICLEIAAFLTEHQRDIEAHRASDQQKRANDRLGRTDPNP